MSATQQEKCFRFKDWKSENGSESNYLAIKVTYSGRFRTKLSSFSEKFRRGLESGSERIKRPPYNGVLSRSFSFRKKILDPQSPFLQKWNKFFVLLCVIAVSLDPLFYYVPVIDDEKKCLSLDSKMEITANVLRSFSDVFYIIRMILQFHTGFIAPSSRVFERGVLVEDSWAIARRYLASYFLVDILSILPLPQKLQGPLEFSLKRLGLELHLISSFTCLQVMSLVPFGTCFL